MSMRRMEKWSLRHLRIAFCASVIAGLASSSHSQDANSAAGLQRQGFEVAFLAGSRDATGHFLGGTEIRSLVAHDGKLFAGNGYWMDRPGSEGFQGAEILVLDQPDGHWRVDHAFEGSMPSGIARNLTVGVLGETNIATDATGKPLTKPISLLLASTWDLTGETRVFARDDATGAWAATTLADSQRIPGAGRLPQVRSFGSHRDRITGIDYAFAGQDPNGIYAGVYDPTVPGRIRWGETPELDVSAIPTTDFPGMEGRLRITSFSECNGRIYAAAGQQIYERIDGPAPSWRLIYTNRNPGRSETGLRGLTTVPNPGGAGQVLLAAVEGTASRIVRVDPVDGSEVTEIDLQSFLGRSWGMEVSYTISAYNNMAKVHDPQGNDVLLIGLEAFIKRESPVPTGHTVSNFGHGQLETDAWYLVRRANGNYDLRRIPDRSDQSMVSTRSIVASPFPGDNDAIYFAGFDANKAPAHNTAWIVRSTIAAAIGSFN
jgi:poly(A) polymerase